MPVSAPPLYATPRHIASGDEYLFYHSIDLPEGTVDGYWDLRPTVREYLGNHDFSGQRVLDVGTAGGFLTFHMEAQGAEVISFDVASGEEWNVVPYHHEGFDLESTRLDSIKNDRRTKNAYWYAHERLVSQSKAYYGDLRSTPPELGAFHTVVLGMILPHLCDPFAALAAVGPLAQETIIVTQQALRLDAPYAWFLPRPDVRQPTDAWWTLSDTCISMMLSVCGFDTERIVRAAHRRTYEGRDEECAAIVAHRRPYGAPPKPIHIEEPVTTMGAELVRLEAERARLEAELVHLEAERACRDAELNHIRSTRAWQAVQSFWRLKARLMR